MLVFLNADFRLDDSMYSGCWLNEISGPDCFGREAFGARLARETALGSKLLYGFRGLSDFTALYRKGGWDPIMKRRGVWNGDGDAKECEDARYLITRVVLF